MPVHMTEEEAIRRGLIKAPIKPEAAGYTIIHRPIKHDPMASVVVFFIGFMVGFACAMLFIH